MISARSGLAGPFDISVSGFEEAYTGSVIDETTVCLAEVCLREKRAELSAHPQSFKWNI